MPYNERLCSELDTLLAFCEIFCILYNRNGHRMGQECPKFLMVMLPSDLLYKYACDLCFSFHMLDSVFLGLPVPGFKLLLLRADRNTECFAFK